MLSYVLMEFHVFQFVPIVRSSVTDNHCKESGSAFITLSHNVFPNLLFFHAMQFQLTQPLLIQKMLQTFDATLNSSQHLSEL